jgi:Shedu protein SduA, C-terminal
MDPDFHWPISLRHKKGAPYNLDGIDVFYDFKWSEYFSDGRMQFRNGKCLARQVLGECPEGKTAALLLTCREEEKERSFESQFLFVMVINFPRYLKLADANAAVSYLAQSFGPGITNIGRFSELEARTPEEVQTLLEQQLTAERIGKWATGNPQRLADLRRIVDTNPTGHSADPSNLIEAVRAIEDLDSELVGALAEKLGRDLDRDARLELLNALTSSSEGRRDAGEVLGRRANERLADARVAIGEYSSHLENPESNETSFQNFIEGNLWLLGLDYVNMRPRHDVPRGALDFILERFDGFHDLLELKDPHDPIIEAPDAEDGRPPSASLYKLSPALSNALAQVHVYRDILTANAQLLDEQYGLPQSRDPSIVIVIGRAAALSPDRSRVLRELNKSLHRVEVVPYDVLGRRAGAILDSVEEYWTAAGDHQAEK